MGTTKLMLFKILKLVGLDVHAEIAAVKGQIEQRVEDLAVRAKQTALTSAVIVALSAFAGLLCVMAMGVGLIALYRALAAAYGVDVALGAIAAVLVAVALILVAVAWMMGRSLSGARASGTGEHLAKSAAASSASASAAPAAQVPPPQVTAPPAPGSAGDLVGALTLLLALFAKDSKLGHPVLDEFAGKMRTSEGGQPGEAVEQALNLVRNGDRTQLLTILGAAALAGWLLARSRPEPAPRDAAPPQ
jgi:hypothetical protein